KVGPINSSSLEVPLPAAILSRPILGADGRCASRIGRGDLCTQTWAVQSPDGTRWGPIGRAGSPCQRTARLLAVPAGTGAPGGMRNWVSARARSPREQEPRPSGESAYPVISAELNEQS